MSLVPLGFSPSSSFSKLALRDISSNNGVLSLRESFKHFRRNEVANSHMTVTWSLTSHVFICWNTPSSPPNVVTSLEKLLASSITHSRNSFTIPSNSFHSTWRPLISSHRFTKRKRSLEIYVKKFADFNILIKYCIFWNVSRYVVISVFFHSTKYHLLFEMFTFLLLFIESQQIHYTGNELIAFLQFKICWHC